MQKINKKIAIKSYKKQHGLHHNKTKNYGRVYWPYLPVLLISILGISFGFFIVSQNHGSKTNQVNYSSLFISTNQYRLKNNLGPLAYNQNLATAAQLQANKIAITNSWTPLTSSQQPAFNLINEQNPNLSLLKENLAYDFQSSNSILSAWSNNNYLVSNLTNTNLNSVGFGIVNATNFMNLKDQKIVVAIFADDKTIPLAMAAKNNFSQGTISGDVKSLAVIRLNTITNNDNIYELYSLAFLMLAIATILLTKHTYKVHKWIIKGKDLVISHPLIDISLIIVFIVLAGALQTTGYIN